MKNFLLALIAMFLWSCSNDDETIYYPAPETGTPVPSKVTYDNGVPAELITYSISYDSERRISKIVKDGLNDRTYLFTYNGDDQVATVAITGFEPALWAFGYDDFTRLATVSNNGSAIPVEYDPVTDIYKLNQFKFKYLANGDLDEIAIYDFIYDPVKKGAFANINSSYQLLGVLIDSIFLQSGTKAAYTSWNINGNTGVLYTNTYNSNDMVTESIVSGFFNMTIKYEFAYL